MNRGRKVADVATHGDRQRGGRRLDHRGQAGAGRSRPHRLIELKRDDDVTRTFPDRVPVGRFDGRAPDRGRQLEQRHVVPRAADTDPCSVNRRAAACNSFELWETDLDLVGRARPQRLPVLGRVGPRRTRAGSLRRRRDRALRGDRRRLPRPWASHRWSRSTTSPHPTGSRRAVDSSTTTPPPPSPATAVGSPKRSATGSPTPSPSTSRICHRLLDWLGLPDFVRDLERATLEAAAVQPVSSTTGPATSSLPEDHEGMQEGLTAAHRAAVGGDQGPARRPSGRVEHRDRRRLRGR